jgi:hypothetical protein
MQNMTDLVKAFQMASLRMNERQKELDDSELDKTSEEYKTLEERLVAATANEKTARELLLDSDVPAEGNKVEPEPEEKDVSEDKDVSEIEELPRRGMTARIAPPKEYRHGENFSTWCSRFRRYLKIGKIDNTSVCELLLNNVDDRTLEKLEPVADKLKRVEKRDPAVFIPIFEQAMYPKSEIRALRQQLTNGKLVQEESEDIDCFASRIRSIANKAYSDPADREEPCLNAILNGMKDDTLYDKVVAVPGAEDNFELAVNSARKFEKMRRTRTTPSTGMSSNELLSVLKVSRDAPNNTVTTPNGERSDQRNSTSHQNYGSQPRYNYRNYNTGGRDAPNDNRICYSCSQPGHIARFCTERSLNTNGNRICYACNQPGHIARFCTDRLNSNGPVGTSNQTTGPPRQ